MSQYDCNILSIAPYKILPAKSGGQLGIIYPHHYLGLLCNDHIVSTEDNEGQHSYSFHLHPILPAKASRYIPYSQKQKLESVLTSTKSQIIFCDHPYMALDAIRLSRKYKIPWFLRSHNIESERFRDFGKQWWPLMHHFEKYAMQKANGVFFVTPEDAEWAIQHYKVETKNAHVAPFGTTLQHAPEEKTTYKEQLAEQLQIDSSKPLLYFLGALDYRPNSEAIEYILNQIIPRLDNAGFEYQILIAGKGLSLELRLQIEQTEHIKYTGFLPDLEVFLNACDIMLNPVLSGGGIKTKAVEALAYNKHVISTKSGALGLSPNVCGSNLHIIPDNEWDNFANAIIEASQKPRAISPSFYEQYYWGNIAGNMLTIMQRRY